MSANKFVRKQIFVDPKVQGTLVFRVIVYWTVCVTTISIMLLCWRMLTGPARMPFTHMDDMWFQYGPALIASFLLLPLVIYDIVRTSNRFTGPLLRLRRNMQALAAGELVKPVRFRDGDFWQELAEDFNAVARHVRNSDELAAHDRPAEYIAAKSADTKQSPETADEHLEISAKAD